MALVNIDLFNPCVAIMLCMGNFIKMSHLNFIMGFTLHKNKLHKAERGCTLTIYVSEIGYSHLKSIQPRKI